jgi:hypothetical protein
MDWYGEWTGTLFGGSLSGDPFLGSFSGVLFWGPFLGSFSGALFWGRWHVPEIMIVLAPPLTTLFFLTSIAPPILL